MNAKAVDGCKLFRDDEDREMFLAMFARELARSGWTCLAYSLMGTHYHLLLRIENRALSSGFQHLNCGYARWFNASIGGAARSGSGASTDVLVESDAHLLEAARYIALNAPRAGMCARPEDHTWCGYGAAIGDTSPDRSSTRTSCSRLFGTTSGTGTPAPPRVRRGARSAERRALLRPETCQTRVRHRGSARAAARRVVVERRRSCSASEPPAPGRRRRRSCSGRRPPRRSGATAA